MNTASRRRLLVLYVIAAAMLISLGGRLWYLQVMNNTAFTKLAAANQTRNVIVPAVRGQILDDVGNRLVTNQTALVVSVDMMNLSQQPGGAAPVLHRLAPLLGMSYKLLTSKTRLCTAGVPQPCWAGSPYQPIPVDQHVSARVALQVMEEQKQFPGVTAQVQPVIDYPQPDGANPAQVLGYLQPITPQEIKSRHLPVTGFSGVDLVGQAGLEAQYDSQLRGKAGTQVVSVNAAGDVTGTVSQAQPVNGDDLVTSLNAQIQADAQKALGGAISRSRASGNAANQGAAIVMTTTGRVVAMASYPDYDPSVWTGGISQQEFNALFGTAGGQPIINWTTQGQYAPGSTFKVTSTAAAVADGYPLNGLYNCPGSVSIAGHTFSNDGEPSLGDMTFSEALIQSCDTVYYNLGYDMYLSVQRQGQRDEVAERSGAEDAEDGAGLGLREGHRIDLPAESTGTIPTRQWLYYLWKDNAHTGQNWCKNGRQFGSYVQQIEWQDCQSGWVWEPGQAAIAAIGQGYVTVTPAAARQRLRRAGQRRDAVQPADRRGAGVADHRPGGAADQPACGPAPAGLWRDARVHPQRAGRRGDPGHRGRRLRRLPAQSGLRGGQDRYRPAVRQERDLGLRLVRAVPGPEVRGPGHGAGLRLWRRRGGARGPADLGQHLRPGGAQGRRARRPGPSSPPQITSAGRSPRRPATPLRSLSLSPRGDVMLGRSTSYTARGLPRRGPGCSSAAVRGPCWPGRSPGTPRSGTWTGS